MRALAISDAHFGAWTGDPLLRHPFALEALAPQLDDVDELILLGDLFDFLFSSVEHAFEQAEGLFSLVQERMQGKRVVWLAGNHDHHIVVRELRTLIELKIATGAMGMDLSDVYLAEHRSFFQRFLDRRLEGVECRIEYPVHRVGRVLLTHGHHLDAHVRNSLPDRLLNRSIWTFAGGRTADRLTLEDYESVIVPLTEFLFTIAQMPKGTAAQQTFYAHLQSVGKILALVGSAGAGVRRGRQDLADHARALAELARERLGRRRGVSTDERAIARACARPNGRPARGSAPMPIARAADPAAPPPVALSAFANVVRNLGWHEQAEQVVFAHTHQPLAGLDTPELRGVRFWNTGSWIYEPSDGSAESHRRYLERAWPGTCVLIDTEAREPELVEVLAEHNPLRGGRGLPHAARSAPRVPVAA